MESQKFELMKKIPIFITVSTLAVIALFIFQVNWLQHSRKLMEEDFSHRVYMALCSAVEKHTDGEGCFKPPVFKPANVAICGDPLEEESRPRFDLLLGLVESDPTFEQSLSEALAFYQIDLDYEISFTTDCLKSNEQASVYQCCVNPYARSEEEQLVNLMFPNKSGYILGKMKLMLFSSFLILLFISSVFIWANWTLWKQKQMNQINIDFFNNMAHEFRTPLTNIALATKMLSKKQPNLSDNTYLNIVQKENKKLMNQVERVLYLAKIEDGDYHLQKETVRLRPLLQEVIQSMDLQIKARGAEIHTQNVASDLILEADRLHLGNVFRNLLDNALKYCGEKPKVTISTTVTKAGVKICFQDNGIGICQQNQQLVFQKFQRVGEGNKHSQKGFGLGLAYVKMIVELHQGFVRVFSDLQKGSRFEVFLPNCTS